MTLGAQAQVSMWFVNDEGERIEEGYEFEEMPQLMYFKFSEALSGDSPVVTFTSESGENAYSRSANRNPVSDYSSFQVWTSYYIKGDLLEEIKSTGVFYLQITHSDGTDFGKYMFRLKKPLSMYFCDSEGSPIAEEYEFDEMPQQMYFRFSEALSGDSPVVTFTSESGENAYSRSATRYPVSDYSSFQVWVSYYIKGDLLEEIKSTGVFYLQITHSDGTDFGKYMFRLKKPLSMYFCDSEGSPIAEGHVFDEMPQLMYFRFSEALSGDSPVVTFTSESGENAYSRSSTRYPVSDYSSFQVWVSYYIKGDLLDEIKSTGVFYVQITHSDGTDFGKYRFGLAPEYIPVTADFAWPEGSLFAGLPENIQFTLSEDLDIDGIEVVINDSDRVESSLMEGSTRDYIVNTSGFPDVAASDGKVELKVYLPDRDDIIDGVTYYVLPSDFMWTPAPGSESGTVFRTLPAALSFGLSAPLPEGAVYEAGIFMKSEPDPDAPFDYPVQFSMDGADLTYDLAAIDAATASRIIDNREFAVGLRLANRTLASGYVLDPRLQDITLGYCSDDLSDQDIFTGSQGAATTVGAAIKIPKAKLEAIKGGKITHMRVAMGEGLERVYAWIRPSLSTPAIVMKRIENPVDGWNEIVFDEPYVITGDEIYIGYSGYQPQGVSAIRRGGTDYPDACWLGIQDVWDDYSMTGNGSLYIQAFGEAALPAVDLGVDNLILDKNFYKNDEELSARYTVINSGAEEIASYTVACLMDDVRVWSEDVTTPIEPDSRVEMTVGLSLQGLSDGVHTLRVMCEVNDVDNPDLVSDNDVVAADVAVYSVSYPRTVLLEQFTTINCVNCPAGTAALKAAVADRDDYVWISHHVGFGVDEFTLEESKELLDYGVIGAPSLMIDRTVVSGSSAPVTIGYSNAAQGGAIIGGYMDKCAAEPSFAGITAGSIFDEDSRELAVSVSVERNAIFSVLNPECNLTVFLTENNLIANVPQSGAGPDYIHDHVIRMALTPALGDKVEWDGDTFTFSKTVTLDEAWNAGRMSVVAILNKPFRADNLADCQVLNCAAESIDAIDVNGVRSVADASALYLGADRSICGDGLSDIKVYLPDGQRVANRNLSAGIYMVSATDASGRKFATKYVVRN